MLLANKTGSLLSVKGPSRPTVTVRASASNNNNKSAPVEPAAANVDGMGRRCV